jgi:hypothetical protein
MMAQLRSARHELYGLPDFRAGWGEHERGLADEVCTELQEISYLCLQGVVDPELIKGNWAGVFVLSWDKLADYVRDYRRLCGQHSELDGSLNQQRRHLELFAEECRDYLSQNRT